LIFIEEPEISWLKTGCL